MVVTIKMINPMIHVARQFHDQKEIAGQIARKYLNATTHRYDRSPIQRTDCSVKHHVRTGHGKTESRDPDCHGE